VAERIDELRNCIVEANAVFMRTDIFRSAPFLCSREGRQVCAVIVAASAKPVFAKPAKSSDGSGSEFWVRVGNATKQLHGDAVIDYQQQHWGT
jgi:hypothetical protein